MADLRKFLYQAGVSTLWGKIKAADEVNLQVVNPEYSSPQPTNIYISFNYLLFCLFSLFNFHRKYPGCSLSSPNNLTVSFIPPIAIT